MDASISASPVQRFARLRRAAYRFYYRVKYFPFTRQRRQRREAQQRGLLVIQIDALAHEDLERALRQGFLPNLKRLLEQEGWELRRFPAGLPSATPAAQAAIFYGTKDDIPAFRFYEKANRRIVNCMQPASVQYVRDRLPRDGILRGGSSYVNLYDGGASRSVFTMAVRDRQPLFQKMGGGRLLLLLLLHPLRTVRMALAGVWEYLREEWDRLASQVRGQYTYYWWYFPLLRIGTNVVLRELQTLAVLLDIYTGVPVIYTTYNAYDEFAHQFGPSARTTLKNLRAVDARIGEMLRMCRRLPGRPYDVFILSDHGQTPAVPYRIKYGETLGDTVVAAAHHGVHVLAETGAYAPPREALDYLVRELEAVAAKSLPPTRQLGLRIGRWLRAHYGLFPLVAEKLRVSEPQQLVVTYSSSLAHLYWTEPPRPLSFDEVRAEPDRRALYYFLVAHRGVGLVVTRMLDGAHVESPTGRALVSPDGEVQVLDGENPLEAYAPTAVERRALVWLAQLPNAGDLVLFGVYDPEQDLCISFDDQVGAHGALGGRQFWPFLMNAPGLVPAGHRIDDPLDLYPLFRRYPMPGRGPDAAHPKNL
jgi:hypothetical protein